MVRLVKANMPFTGILFACTSLLFLSSFLQLRPLAKGLPFRFRPAQTGFKFQDGRSLRYGFALSVRNGAEAVPAVRG